MTESISLQTQADISIERMVFEIYCPLMNIYIAGINGLVGSNVAAQARDLGHQVFGKTSKDLDLTNRKIVFEEFAVNKVDVLIIAAAKVGGIGVNYANPVAFLSKNLQIQTNLIDAAHEYGIEKVIFLGSSCIYPKFAPQPLREEFLLGGKLEPTNQAYAIAKLAGIELINSYNREYSKNWISLLPCNLYGPGDNFNPLEGHVLASLIQKIHLAKIRKDKTVMVWGDGSPLREFLYIQDAAQGIIHVAEGHVSDEIVNLGSGEEISISALARLIGEIIGYKEEFVYDLGKPNGTPRKVMDVTKMKKAGWNSTTNLKIGIEKTYRWYLSRNLL